MSEAIKRIVEEVFGDDILLNFWTHQKCPPSVNDDFKKCQIDKNIKHERCMPCWKAWLKGKSKELAGKLEQAGYLEEVQLEVLRDEEIWNAKYTNTDERSKLLQDSTKTYASALREVEDRKISQVTCQHNEAKGKLYRIKE